MKLTDPTATRMIGAALQEVDERLALDLLPKEGRMPVTKQEFFATRSMLLVAELERVGLMLMPAKLDVKVQIGDEGRVEPLAMVVDGPYLVIQVPAQGEEGAP